MVLILQLTIGVGVLNDLLFAGLAMGPGGEALLSRIDGGQTQCGLSFDVLQFRGKARGAVGMRLGILRFLEGCLAAPLGNDGAVALDIEPLPADHILRTFDNAVLSPHLGYVSDVTYRGYYDDMVDNVRQWRAGKLVRLVK